MPEGPETRRMADKIGSALINKKIDSINYFHPSLKGLNRTKVIIIEVTSRGKAVVIRFNNGMSIISHNQLYGRWTTNYLKTKIKHNRKLRIEFCVNNKAIRLWSATDIKYLKTMDENSHNYIKNLGPDVLDETTTYDVILKRLVDKKFKNRNLAGLLLNQNFIAGLGNYLRSEILFYSKIMYDKKPKDLNLDEKNSLSKNIKDISIRSYKQKGKTLFEDDLMLKYLDSSVKRRRFMVFARENLRCFICNSKIKKEYISSRRIYYCTVCQR